jgi:hypothetical protein
VPAAASERTALRLIVEAEKRPARWVRQWSMEVVDEVMR